MFKVGALVKIKIMNKMRDNLRGYDPNRAWVVRKGSILQRVWIADSLDERIRGLYVREEELEILPDLNHNNILKEIIWK